jgi:PmbA protein
MLSDFDFDPYRLSQWVVNLIEKNYNVKCCEAYVSKDEFLSIEIEENSIKYSTLGVEKGISVRVFDIRGGSGFAFTNRFKKQSLEKMVRKAAQLMKGATSDPDFKSIPKKYQKYPNVKKIYDKDIKQIDIEDSSQYVNDLIEVCKKDEMALSQSAYFKVNCSEIYVLNSNGINVDRKETSCTISSNIIVKDKETNQSSFGSDWQAVRNINEIDAKKVAQTALKIAKRNVNRKKIESMRVPLVLTPRGAINLILKPISVAINGETFQNKRSFLVGHKGEKIGSELITIKDNGLIDGAIGSSICDDEGVPSKNKIIIKQGKFLENGLLHNSYTAGKEGVESTGNAVRSSYSSPPSIGVNNFKLLSGSSSQEEMINEISRGILFDYTGDSPNLATGDFSGLILQGNLIREGMIDHPLNETMIGINLFDLFNNISAVSKESDTYGRYSAPYVKIKNVNVIGSA